MCESSPSGERELKALRTRALLVNWQIVRMEQVVRYERDETQSRELYQAIIDTSNGCCHGSEPLVTEQIEAGKKFIDKFDKYVPVRAASGSKPAKTRAGIFTSRPTRSLMRTST